MRWIGLERQLVELYAATYLRIWYFQQLEERLNVPDCTGGIPPNGVPSP